MLLFGMIEFVFYSALAVLGLFALKIALQFFNLIKVLLTYDCGHDEEYPN